MVSFIFITTVEVAKFVRIFIIEGLPTVVMGIATLWLLPNDPDHVSFEFRSGVKSYF